VTDQLLDRGTERTTGPDFLQLTFLMSAYNTAQRMIWFSDQKASFIVIYYGILLSMLGLRVERLLGFFRAPDAAAAPRALLVLLGLAFLATMVFSLVYALRTVLPTYVTQVDVGEYKRLYWCHDILAKDVETYFESLRGLDGEGPTKEMTRELYSAVQIERIKFARVTRSLKAAVASFAVWVLIFAFTLFV
jgi:pycsar effector protein